MTADRGRTGVRTFRPALPLLLALACTIALAWLALRATREQRSAASQTVTDFADFAAFIVGSGARQEIERRLLYAFAPVRAWDPASGEPLPDPALVGRDRAEAGRCAASGIPEPSFARVDFRTGSLALAGTPIPDETARWLADTLTAEVASVYRPGWSFAHIFGDEHGIPVIAYTVVRDSAGSPVAAYAKSSCLAIGGRSVFEIALASTTALPPSLTRGLPDDSLMTLYVRDPHGHVIHESELSWASPVVGRTGPMPQLGNLDLVVDLRPGLADRLVPGGIPYGGAPMALMLLVLIVVSGGLALLQVRRQQELMRARERFISNVSHELRTPLQQILMFAELLSMDRLESEGERRHSIEVVEREARRLVQLVENVLAFARSARNGVVVGRERVELEPLVRETVRAFGPLARANGTTVEMRFEGDTVATGDADAIRRVLLNLLDNAVKYGPAGQTVSVTVARAAGSIVLSVEDAGPGVPAAQRDRIWMPFGRLEPENGGATAGSGIGLSIVRDLVRAMEGQVVVEDADGGGARFIVTLGSAD